MLINQDFTQDRTKYLGGSDIGALLGLSTYRTPLELWLEKTGQEVPQADSLPLRFGSFAEAFVAAEYTRSTGFSLVHDESIYIHPKHAFMSAHIDRFVLGDGPNRPATHLLECKTANPFTKGQWGDVGSDQVPMSYLCQCIWYMAITQLERVDLAVLFGNSELRIYVIERDLALEELVIGKALQFWQDHVLAKVPPPAHTEDDYQILFKQGDPSQTVEATAATIELVRQWHDLTSQSKVLDAQMGQIKQQLMETLQEAQTLTYEGQVIATWKAPKPSYRFDSKRLESEDKALYERFMMPIQNSRRLVIKGLNEDH